MTLIARPAALAATLALFAALGLAGCTGTDTPIPIEDGIGGEVPDETDGDGLTTDVGGDCLPGRWLFSQAELQSYYDAVGASTDLTIVIDGTAELDFTTSTYEYLLDYTYSTNVADVGDMIVVVGGSVGGDYTVTDGVFTTVNDHSNTTMDATLNGTPLDVTDMINQVISEHPINNTSYHCEGGAPVVNFVIPGGGTHPVRLEAL